MSTNALPVKPPSLPDPEVAELNAAISQLDQIKGLLVKRFEKIEKEKILAADADKTARNQRTHVEEHEQTTQKDDGPSKKTTQVVLNVVVLFCGLLTVIILTVFLVTICSKPDPLVYEAYRTLGEMKGCVQQLQAQRDRDDTQDARLTKLETPPPPSNSVQKIDVTVKGVDLSKSQPIPSIKSVGILHVDSSSH